MNQDTIAAIATAPGRGGIGIIRLSGPESERVLREVFRPASAFPAASSWPSHRMIYGHLTNGDEILDEGMAVLMRAPRSYTREDVVEIQLHGSAFLLEEALELCLKKGARLAGPGEFTRMAFLNGRIDLSQAEAVMSLIHPETDRQRRAAVRQLEGGASAFVRDLSSRLNRLQAGIAACIDYPEEASEEEGAAGLRPEIEALIRDLESAVDERGSRLLYDGLRVTLFGRPNGGKSSLLNRLTGEDRAIVTDIPGTTRDVIRGEMTLDGIRIHLEDTAGLRESDDLVERLGVDRSEKAIREADLRLLVLDASAPPSEEDLRLAARLSGEDAVVLSKRDLPPRLRPEDLRRRMTGSPEILTASVLEPNGLADLKAFLARKAKAETGLAVTLPRHLDAIRRARGHLRDALRTLETGPLDLCSVDLQSAQEALCEITGERAGEKLLDEVFSAFCVGK